VLRIPWQRAAPVEKMHREAAGGVMGMRQPLFEIPRFDLFLIQPPATTVAQ
jgi:hypothetical protein